MAHTVFPSSDLDSAMAVGVSRCGGRILTEQVGIATPCSCIRCAVLNYFSSGMSPAAVGLHLAIIH